MKILEYLFDQNVADTVINDSSGQGNHGQINPVTAAGGSPALIDPGQSPSGYAFKSLRFDVDSMPPAPAGGPEPDNQLQFLRVPVTPSILNINNTRAFTLSFWAYHEALPKSDASNPWDDPRTLSGKEQFCPQQCCGAEAFYVFVRTKNIGTSVPVEERGELAFTGDGPAIVQAGGIDASTLGGVTSQGYHVPINQWVHIACVLEPPAAGFPGSWKIYVDGDLKGAQDALPQLADPNVKLFSTDAAGNPAPGVDIRFGNFRGHFPPNGVLRPDPIKPGANDYAFNGNLTAIRMFDHAQSQGEICADISNDLNLPQITLDTPTLVFNDVPEGETTYRAVVLSVKSCAAKTFNISAGPTVTSGPGNFELTPLGAAASLGTSSDYDTPRQARIWIAHTATSDGDVTEGSATVRCVETGETFPVTITANTVARPTVAVALALDESGSMASPSGISNAAQDTRIEVLRFAAGIFADVIQPENGIGIVRFATNASTAMPVTEVGPYVVPGPPGAGRIAANMQIGGHNAGPSSALTSIGDALERAREILEPASGYQHKAIVVFTDGHETAPKYIANVSDLINERVFAIGLGTADQLRPAALTALSNGTGGYVAMTGDLAGDDYYRVTKYFLQILAGVTNADVVLDPEAHIKPGQEHTYPFVLAESDISADVILAVQREAAFAFQFFLEAPDGTLIDPALTTVTPGAEYNVGRNVLLYRLTLPVPLGAGAGPGTWRVRIKTSDKYFRKYLGSLENYPGLLEHTKTHGIRYNLSIQSRSNLRMVASLTQDSYSPGASMTLRARLTEYGVPLTSPASLRAELERPDGSMTTLPLGAAGEGVYEASLEAGLPGVYRFNLLANGKTLRGREFTREHLLTGAVYHGGDQPPPSTPPGGDGQDDRLCCLLDCLLRREVLGARFEAWLKERGVDLGVVRRCLLRCCKRSPKQPFSLQQAQALSELLSPEAADSLLADLSAASDPADAPSLEEAAQITQLLKPDVLEALRGVLIRGSSGITDAP